MAVAVDVDILSHSVTLEYRNKCFLVALYRLILHKTLFGVANLNAPPSTTKITRVALKTRGNSMK